MKRIVSLLLALILCLGLAACGAVDVLIYDDPRHMEFSTWTARPC